MDPDLAHATATPDDAHFTLAPRLSAPARTVYDDALHQPARDPAEARGLRGALAAAVRQGEVARALMLAADAAAVAASLGIGVQVLVGAPLHPSAILAIPIAVVLGRLSGVHPRRDRRLAGSTLADVPRLAQLATLLAVLASVAGDHLVYGGWTGTTTLVLWLSLLISMPLARGVVRHIPIPMSPERCLVVGDLSRSARVRRTINALSGGRTTVIAWVTPEQLMPDDGRPEPLLELVADQRVEHVILAPAIADSDCVVALIRCLEDLEVRITLLPRLLEVVSATATFDAVGGATGLEVRRIDLPRAARAVKSAMDGAGAALVLVAGAPVLALIAVAVKVSSPGPVFFRQQRIGRDGAPFSIYKFRTMDADAEARKDDLRAHNQADGLFKVADDPRITPVGRFLRRSSLDELPQLLNVFRGEMSLVGPRPLVPEEDGTIAGWHRRRLRMRPGMTGVWQVLGSARVPLHEMVELDHLYVLNWSPWLDLKIMLHTVAFVLARRGL